MWVSIILYLHELSQHFKMKDIRPAKYIVGLEIHQDRAHRTLHFNQHKYTLNMLKWFNLENCKLVSTTLDPSHFHWHIYWSNHWKCSDKFSLKSSKPKIHWFISVGAVSVRYWKLKTHGWTHWVSVYPLSTVDTGLPRLSNFTLKASRRFASAHRMSHCWSPSRQLTSFSFIFTSSFYHYTSA